MTRCSSTHHKGFTLLEISIVLVIIGLVVGGVLVGRDLIRAAGLRSVVTGVEQFKMATNTFKMKYNALPGDITNPQTFFGWSCPAWTGDTRNQGNGNGLIDNNNGSNFYEPWMGICQLGQRGSGLLPYDLCSGYEVQYNGCPAKQMYMPLKYENAQIYISDYTSPCSGQNCLWLNSANMQNNSGDWRTGALRPVDAYNIDEKMDDGLPFSGKVTGQDSLVWNGGTHTWTTCVHNSTYDINGLSSNNPGGNNPNCTMAFHLGI